MYRIHLRALTAFAVMVFVLAPLILAAADAIVVGGATAEGFVASTAAARFNRGILLVNTDQKDIELTVDFADFVAPDSRSIPTAWRLNEEESSVQTVKIPPRSRRCLTSRHCSRRPAFIRRW